MVHSIAVDDEYVYVAQGGDVRTLARNDGKQCALFSTDSAWIEKLGITPQKFLVGILPTAKELIVWNVPSLEVVSRRVFPKRPTAWTIAGDSLVVSDKQGDVYAVPLLATSQDEPVVDAEGSALIEPILGHVSVLLSVAAISSTDPHHIITSDRDEHIRVSRWPDAFVIERYLWGHHQYVAHLVPFGDDLLVSAGGDDTIFCWNWRQGEKVGTYRLPQGDVSVVQTWSPSSVLVAVNKGTTAWELELPTLTLKNEWTYDEPVRSAAKPYLGLDTKIVMPGTDSVISIEGNDNVSIWNPAVFKKPDFALPDRPHEPSTST